MKHARTLLVLALSLLGLAAARPAWAHGGGTLRLANAEAGPYRVSVWTEPDVTRVGEVHVTVGVAEPAPNGQDAGPPVLDAAVAVTAVSGAGGRAMTAEASRADASNKLFYEADVVLRETGPTRFEVRVSGPLGAGMAGFEVEVLPAATTNVPLLVGAGVALVVAAWLVQARSAGRRERTGLPARPGRNT